MHINGLDLERTLRQCRQGNALAWEALVKAFQARVFGVARYYLKNTDEAQDVTQDIFVKLYQQLGRFERNADAFEAWILAIARNSCLDRIRKSKARNKYEEEFKHSVLNPLDSEENPEALSVEEQRRQMMYQALSEFDDTSRDIVLLKEIQGLKIEEVAEILSLPEGTVKSRSNRARLELARRLMKLTGSEPGSSGAF